MIYVRFDVPKSTVCTALLGPKLGSLAFCSGVGCRLPITVPERLVFASLSSILSVIGCPGWAEQRLGRQPLSVWQSLARKAGVWSCDLSLALARGSPLSQFPWWAQLFGFVWIFGFSLEGIVGRVGVGGGLMAAQVCLSIFCYGSRSYYLFRVLAYIISQYTSKSALNLSTCAS